jgi:hypothetical protein
MDKRQRRFTIIVTSMMVGSFLLMASAYVYAAFGETTIQSHKDSLGYTHTTVRKDNHERQTCLSKTDSLGYTNTRCW